VNNKFPFDWTSTQLDGIVQGITDVLGYDIPISVVFGNVGAPRFMVKKDEQTVIFNVSMAMYPDHKIYEEHRILTAFINNVEVKFGVNFEYTDQTFITFDWRNITLGSANVDLGPLVNESINNNIKINTQTTGVLKWFEWALQFILPWVNKYHPMNISNFLIPTHFDTLDIQNFQVDIFDYFISMSMNPVFRTG
jgi:hypothetical protein